MKWFFMQCDALITPSQMIADIIWDHTCFLPRVISNGVDLDLFSPAATHSIESQKLSGKYHFCSNRPVILYVGRIDPAKKVDLVLQAFAKVVREVDAQLLIVGDETQRDEIIQLSRSLDAHQHCSFPGFVPKEDDLPGIYRLGSVFVTVSEIEIQSSVVLEAAASGLPVVTVQVSSMPEFVIEGENGYLVAPGDIPALAERLICLVKNQKKSKMMGQAGRIIAEAHSNQGFLQEHEQLYGSLLHLSNRELKEKTAV
jgi:glycosyltransferase involved in cell wall biosynthesis